MKEGWEYRTLGECCEKINGLWKGKKEPFVNVGVIRNANFTKEMTLDFSNIEYLYVEEKQFKTRKLRKGDLIVEKSGGSEKQPVGRAVLFLKEEGDYSFSNFTSVLRILNKDELLYNFLYKYLLYIYRRGDTKSMQKATTGIHNIEFEKYLNIQVPIIPIDEQRRIVSYLDSSFKLIDEIKNKALKSLTEAKALFQSALAEAMEPKDGWEYIELSKKCKVQNGFAFNSKDFNCINGLPLIRIRDIKRGFSETYTNEYCSSDYIVENGDLLVGMDGDFNVGIWKGGHALLNQRVCMIKPLNNYNIKFLYYYLPNILNRINQKTSFSTVKHLSSKQVNKINIPDIILDEQSQIVSHLDSLSSKVRAIEEKYQKMVEECDALKQAMLRDVFE